MDVIGGGLLVAVAALLWIAYLLPSWLRRRQYLATERNAVRLQQTLRILAETAETPEAVRVEATAREVAAQQRILHQHEAAARLAAEAAEHLAIAERRAAEDAVAAARDLATWALAVARSRHGAHPDPCRRARSHRVGRRPSRTPCEAACTPQEARPHLAGAPRLGDHRRRRVHRGGVRSLAPRTRGRGARRARRRGRAGAAREGHGAAGAPPRRRLRANPCRSSRSSSSRSRRRSPAGRRSRCHGRCTSRGARSPPWRWRRSRRPPS